MTTAEYNANLQKFISDLNQNNRPLKRAATSSVQQVANRIFVEGRKSNGAEIGTYNTTEELYVNPNNSPKGFKPEGKPIKVGVKKSGKNKGQDILLRNTVRLEGKNVVDHKTRWFPSYKAFREFIGRPADKINLVLSGDLQADFRKANIGSQAQVTKIDANKYVIQIDRTINEKKLEGIEKRKGEITDLMLEEREKFEKNVELELLNDMQKSGLI